MAEEKWYQTVLKYRSIRQLGIILFALLGIILLTKISINLIQNKPLLTNITFKEKEQSKQVQKAENSSANNLAEHGSSLSTQSTTGKESPIMSGHSTYKPDNRKTQNKLIQIDYSQNHTVKGDLNGGVNGDVYTSKLTQRKVTAALLFKIKSIASIDKVIHIAICSQDIESMKFIDELELALQQLGYNESSYYEGAYMDRCRPGKIICDTDKTSITLYICSQYNAE